MIKGLKADILGMLESKIESIFLECQNAIGIKSGDISPLDALQLEQKEKELAELITEIIFQQKGCD